MSYRTAALTPAQMMTIAREVAEQKRTEAMAEVASLLTSLEPVKKQAIATYEVNLQRAATKARFDRMRDRAGIVTPGSDQAIARALAAGEIAGTDALDRKIAGMLNMSVAELRRDTARLEAIYGYLITQNKVDSAVEHRERKAAYAEDAAARQREREGGHW